MNKETKLLFIVGETGSGKDTIAQELGFGNFVVSYSTRKMRDTDIQGVNHYFVSDPEMDKLIAENGDDIIAYTYTGVGDRYCALKKDLKPGLNIYIINPDGIRWFKQNAFKDLKYYTVYIHTPLKTRIERCKHRNDFDTSFHNRVMDEAADFSEFRLSDDYNLIIRNDDYKKSAEIIRKAVALEFGE